MIPNKLIIRPNKEQITKYISGKEDMCPISQAIKAKYFNGYNIDINTRLEGVWLEHPLYGIVEYCADTVEEDEYIASFIYAVDSQRHNGVRKIPNSKWIHLHVVNVT